MRSFIFLSWRKIYSNTKSCMLRWYASSLPAISRTNTNVCFIHTMIMHLNGAQDSSSSFVGNKLTKRARVPADKCVRPPPPCTNNWLNWHAEERAWLQIRTTPETNASLDNTTCVCFWSVSYTPRCMICAGMMCWARNVC